MSSEDFAIRLFKILIALAMTAGWYTLMLALTQAVLPSAPLAWKIVPGLSTLMFLGWLFQRVG